MRAQGGDDGRRDLVAGEGAGAAGAGDPELPVVPAGQGHQRVVGVAQEARGVEEALVERGGQGFLLRHDDRWAAEDGVAGWGRRHVVGQDDVGRHRAARIGRPGGGLRHDQAGVGRRGVCGVGVRGGDDQAALTGPGGGEVAGDLTQDGLHRDRSLGAHRGDGTARGEGASLQPDDGGPLRSWLHQGGLLVVDQPPREEPGPARGRDDRHSPSQ